MRNSGAGMFRPNRDDWDKLVRELPHGSVPMTLIAVVPRNGESGLNEERGAWIESLWRNASARHSGIVGLRLTWNQVMLFWPGSTSDEAASAMSSLLKEAATASLKSLALCSAAAGGEAALRELERMELQLAKIGYWREHIFPTYYQDGAEVPLRAS